MYETGTILNPEIADDQLNELITRIEGEIEKGGGKIVEIDQWGVKKLAYRIQRQQRGYYTFFKYCAPPAAVTQLEYQLRVYEDVIRFMTLVLESDMTEQEVASLQKVHKKPEVVEKPEAAPVETDEAKSEEPVAEKPEAAPVETDEAKPEEPVAEKPAEAEKEEVKAETVTETAEGEKTEEKTESEPVAENKEEGEKE